MNCAMAHAVLKLAIVRSICQALLGYLVHLRHQSQLAMGLVELLERCIGTQTILQHNKPIGFDATNYCVLAVAIVDRCQDACARQTP